MSGNPSKKDIDSVYRRLTPLLLVLAIIAAACSTTLTREDAIDDLVDEG